MSDIVETRYGRLKGTEGEYARIYKGIPYAQPPVGSLRFQVPKQQKQWEGILSANKFPPMCPQGLQEEGSFYQKEFYDNQEYMPHQSEDCLYLNIWVPKEGKGDYPVAICYHGGAYAGGFCSEMEFDGEAYAKRGIILITAAYRLGLFGFFAHPKLHERDGHSGNYGLLDQIAVIDWVRDNISAFGGDKNRITIMGQSAGGMSVRTLVSSPLVKGKICGAIIQSGGGYQSPFPVNVMDGRKLEEACALYLEQKGMVLEELYEKNSQEILQLQGEMWQFVAAQTKCIMPFCPQVDGYSLLKTCDQILVDDEVLKIPYLIGCNQNDISKEETTYMQNPLHMSNVAFCEMQKENKDVYLYYFKRHMPGDDMGAFHSAELWYMFGTLERCWRPLTEADKELSEEMLDAWSSFIQSGTPGWKRYSEEDSVVKEFDIR